MELMMANRAERMETTLKTLFSPSFLEIEDESRRHAHHAGRNNLPDGETHYRIKMVSEVFAGQNRLARQRAVNEALATEFSSGLHALSMSLRTPQEG